MTTGTAVTWQQFVTCGGWGGGSYLWSRLMAGRRVLISMDSRIWRRHILSSRVINLTLSFLMGCSWSPTAVRGDFCFMWSFIFVSRVWAVSLRRAFQTLDFIDDAPLLWSGILSFGMNQDGAQGVEGLVESPDSMFFLILASFSMYLWYTVSPRWCGPGLMWYYERCQTCFWAGDLEGPLLVAIGLQCGLNMPYLSIFLLRSVCVGFRYTVRSKEPSSLRVVHESKYNFNSIQFEMFIVSSITEYNTAHTFTYNKALANIQQV